MEGESVTLHSDVTDIQSYYLTLWRFGDDGFTIARINRDKIIYSDIPAFRDRMVLDDQTGSLTITNSRIKHSGLYKMEISNSTGTSVKKFRLTVYDSPFLIEAEKGELKTVSVTEGDPAYLMMEDVDTQRYDLIVWRFGDEGILIVKGDREDNKTTFSYDEIYEDRLELNYQTGSLTITDARITDTGLYKVKISGDRRAEYLRFILTVSASGISSGGVAGIVIVVLLAMSGAVGVFVIFIRRRTSEIKKQNDVFVDKTVSVKTGDSVILHTDVKAIQKDDEITWMFEETSIAKMKGDQTIENIDDRFRNKLKLNPQTGSLIIKDTKTEHTGLYKVKMRLQDVTSAQIFSVSESDKLSVNEGDPFTLNSGQTELGNNVMTWRFKDKDIATVSEHQAPVCVEERFKDRVHVDPQTGSLTVRNSKTKDSGLYQLQISTEKSQRKFTVRVREKIRKVSVMEGDSFTLNTGDGFIQRPDMIKWMFKHKSIAELIGKRPSAAAAVDKDERFTDRLKMDHQTGSLTVTNSRTTDSGLYTLKIDSEDSEWKFSVNVRGRLPWDKRPERKEVKTQDESELPMIPVSSSRMDDQTDCPPVKNILELKEGGDVLQTRLLPYSESESEATQEECLGRTPSRKNTKEKFRKVSVMEGESFTLNTGDAFTQRSDMIKWEFKYKSIAELIGKRPSAAAVVDKDERFTHRLELDHQTGSLTVTNSRTTDSGLYTLKIGSEDSEWKFSVNVRVNPQDESELPMIPVSSSRMDDQTDCPPVKNILELKEEKFRKVSVMEGESFTLNTGDAFTQRSDMIKWEFKYKSIAELIGKRPSAAAVVDKDERFTHRLELDHQTGSLTVTNSRTTDSGLYTLKIGSEDSEWKFSVNVRVKTQDESELPMIPVSSSRMDDQTDCPPVKNILELKEEKFRKVSVMEGESFTLNTGDAFIQRPDMIRWIFGHKCIAELIGNKKPASSNVDSEIHGDRLELDYKTASLTITNTRTTDSGLYKLMITPEMKFNVTVTGRLGEKRPEQKTENINRVSVNEGESLTLSTGDALTQSPDMIKWMFKNICIAEFTGIQRPAADVDKDDRFTDRLELDYNNGSLTITNITSKDSGRYRLRIKTGDSERTFNFTVGVLSTKK
ncbi:hypothetical protein E1301_Tti012772 [Triplophysa tibetana]|uniref:Ig-like domain-containing protein n=1 Tax=Triplophysa tibetana TaxID=1572043 RepID=A0A5A9NUP5_9TELE|nr:hypothetical protein E1301_Tti012772 [Triplophysa tibetana]